LLGYLHGTRLIRSIKEAKMYQLSMKHFGLWLLAVSVVWASGCGPIHFAVGVSPSDQELTSTVVTPDGHWFSDRVAVIDVSGMIMNAPKPGLIQRGENPVSVLHEQLQEAADDRRVKAVVLRLNTPGGGVTASDMMYRDVLRFREMSGKPVVALMMDVTASGGYYLACAADQIVTYPTSVVGSIGVIVQTVSVKPALAKIGVKTEALTSGKNKDAGSPLSTLTDDHRKVLQGLVDDYYARFTAIVREARPGIPVDRFADLTDGRVVSGEQAAAQGLADLVGDINDAGELAAQLAGIEHADLIVYHRRLEYVGSPYAVGPGAPNAGASGSGTQINLMQLNMTGSLPGFDAPVGVYYLWRPDLP
jgi:protease-4